MACLHPIPSYRLVGYLSNRQAITSINRAKAFQSKARTVTSLSTRNVKPHHRVRLSPRKLTWKSAATTSLAIGLSVSILWLSLGIFALELDDAEDTGSIGQVIEAATRESTVAIDDDEKMGLDGKGLGPSSVEPAAEGEDELDEIPDETPEDAWFIPLWSAQPVPARVFNSEDPEWHAFAKFAKDLVRQDQIRDTIIAVTLKALNRNKFTRQAMGNGITLSGHNFTFEIPPGPPPSYERYGLEWADEYIALLHRPVNPISVERARRALWPKTVTLSTYATLREVLRMKYGKFKRVIGLEQEPGGSVPFTGGVGAIRKSTAGSGKGDIDHITTLSPHSKTSPEGGLPGILSILPNYPRDNQQERPGLAIFKRELSRKWRPILPPQPAGSVRIRGHIQYRGSTASCIVEVEAGFMVSESTLISVRVDLRRIEPHHETQSR